MSVNSAPFAPRSKEWVPAMQARLGVATVDLPALWDADFCTRANPGGDRYVLCEINVSSILPFPQARRLCLRRSRWSESCEPSSASSQP